MTPPVTPVRHMPPSTRQQGLTLVELLVALVIGMLITIATYATLTVARQGFGTVSTSSQLRDNARFATAIIQQLATQSGYKDEYNATAAQSSSDQTGFNLGGGTGILFVEGLDNAKATISNGAVAKSGDGPGASDVLVLRSMPGLLDEAGTVADGSLINCAGEAQTVTGSPIQSVLYIDTSSNEPTLMCRRTGTNGNWVNTSTPLLSGVETLQVLYGVNTDNAFTTASGFRFMTASEVSAASRWQDVRSLRIGMVMRADAGSGQVSEGTDSDDPNYYPLGEAFKDTAGGTFADPKDGRIRQVITFTVQLRNNLAPQVTATSTGSSSGGESE